MSRLTTLRQRLSGLDGWHRLFVAFAGLWSVPVLLITVGALVESQTDYRAPTFDEKLAQELRMTPLLREAATKVERLPDGSRGLCFDCSPDELRALSRFEDDIFVRVGEWSFHPSALLSTMFWWFCIWVFPLTTTYGLARLVGWVVQGFRAG